MDKYKHMYIEELGGIPLGKAACRLDRILIFEFGKRCGLGKCYVCGNEIKSVRDFSIEHKIPWRNSGNLSLYWDLENIAFSHKECNRPYHGRISTIKTRNPYKGYAHSELPLRKIEFVKYKKDLISSGKSICSRCGNVKDLAEFNKRKHCLCGINSQCRECFNFMRRGSIERTMLKFKRMGPNDTWRCRICKLYKNREEFYVNKEVSHGVSTMCKKCDSRRKKHKTKRSKSVENVSSPNLVPQFVQTAILG